MTEGIDYDALVRFSIQMGLISIWLYWTMFLNGMYTIAMPLTLYMYCRLFALNITGAFFVWIVCKTIQRTGRAES